MNHGCCLFTVRSLVKAVLRRAERQRWKTRNGVAENFHVEQNRELLEKLSAQTGGRYYRPNEVSRLGEDISYSDAGITVRETKDLWDMPIVFFFALLVCCSEWLLRRRWGVV